MGQGLGVYRHDIILADVSAQGTEIHTYDTPMLWFDQKGITLIQQKTVK